MTPSMLAEAPNADIVTKLRSFLLMKAVFPGAVQCAALLVDIVHAGNVLAG